VHCGSNQAKIVLPVYFGDVRAGEHEFSDIVVGAKGNLDGCGSPEFRRVEFKTGAPLKKREEEIEANRIKDLRQREQWAREKEAARLREEQRAKDFCHDIFKQTASKKVGDLTVAEDRAVKACDGLGYYN
jgi:hypothetical protein